MTCGICGRSGLHGDEGLRNHRRFNKTCSDIMDQIRAARRSVKIPSKVNQAISSNGGSTRKQDGSTSMAEPQDEDKEDDRHHLWVLMQLALTVFYMYFIYAYKMY